MERGRREREEEEEEEEEKKKKKRKKKKREGRRGERATFSRDSLREGHTDSFARDILGANLAQDDVIPVIIQR